MNKQFILNTQWKIDTVRNRRPYGVLSYCIKMLSLMHLNREENKKVENMCNIKRFIDAKIVLSTHIHQIKGILLTNAVTADQIYIFTYALKPEQA